MCQCKPNKSDGPLQTRLVDLGRASARGLVDLRGAAARAADL